MVSIVIPTYNRAHLLPRALDACLGQTYRNIEIIVVNDGSRDGTESVLRQYADRDSRIRPINKHNEGIPDTVNRGWRESRGQYVTWTSDDNFYAPEAIDTMVTYLEEHPDIGMVYTDSRYIDCEGNNLGVVPALEPETLEYQCAPSGCLLFRREVFQSVGMFRRQWIRCHDFDFYHRVYKQYKVARLPEVLYVYQWHEASMSGNREAHTLEHIALLKHHAINSEKMPGILGGAYGYLGCWFGNQGQWWKAFRYYNKAARYDRQYRRAARRSLAVAAYGLVPESLKHGWRTLKKCRSSAGAHTVLKQ